MSNLNISQFPAATTNDPVNDLLLLWQNSTLTTKSINRNNLLGLASSPVGISDVQTLTSKTITSPTISSPTLSGTVTGTYTLGGTPTFPASVVTLTGSQTLTNKILTSPTINSATISNPTLSVDTITGYTVATNVTAGGVTLNNGAVGGTTGTFSSTLSVTGAGTVGGLLTASNGLTLSSGTLTLPNNSIVAANLATSAITLGYAQTTTTFNTTSLTAVQYTGLSVTVTIPAGSRKIKITAYTVATYNNGGVGDGWRITIWDGTVGSGTQLSSFVLEKQYAVFSTSGMAMAIVTPSAGTKTYNVGINVQTGGTAVTQPSSIGPDFILVEAI